MSSLLGYIGGIVRSVTSLVTGPTRVDDTRVKHLGGRVLGLTHEDYEQFGYMRPSEARSRIRFAMEREVGY